MTPVFAHTLSYVLVGTDPILTQNTHLAGRVARVCPDSPRAFAGLLMRFGYAQLPLQFAFAGRTQGSAPTGVWA
jgi:hypothetical protein